MDRRTLIATGDAREVLKAIPAPFAHTAISSPPYWRQRDYGMAGQLGQEETVEEYVENLCRVYDGVRNALYDTGTNWVNLGDNVVPKCDDEVAGYESCRFCHGTQCPEASMNVSDCKDSHRNAR